MNDIVPTLDNAPDWLQFIVWGVVAIVIISIVFINVREYIGKLIGYLPKRKSSKSKFLEHDIFSTSDSINRYLIDRLFFGDADRDKIFKMVASIINMTIVEKLKYIIEHHDIVNMKKTEFTNLMYTTLSDILKTYKERIGFELNKLYPESGNIIYNLIIEDTKKGFMAMHSQNLEFLEQLIRETCDSAAYDNNEIRFNIILSNYKTSLDITLPHIEKSFLNFNGDLAVLLK